MKILSITIPSYNVEKYLPEILPSYLNDETVNDLEVIIVNDGSRDKTAEIAEEFRQQFPQTIKVVNKQNGGHGSTINTGIKEAAGKYFKVVDGDDWVDSDGLVRLIQILKEMDVDLVINPYMRVNAESGEKELKAVSGFEYGKVYEFDDVIMKLTDFYQLHSNTYRTSVLKTMRPIDEHCFYVDQEYISYPLDSIKTVVCLNFPVYQYRVGNSDQSMSFTNMQKNRHMHKRVIDSLIQFLKETPHSANVDMLLRHKIQKMIQIQIDTYFTFKRSSSIKEELIDFYDNIKKQDVDLYNKTPGKKAMCLRSIGAIGYDIICALRRSGT